jgi:hypothetical protein
MPVSDIVQPLLASASRSCPTDAPDWILAPLSMMASLILARGSMLTSSNTIDSSTTASFSTTTAGDRMDFHTVPPLMMQPSQTIDSGVLPPNTIFVGGSRLWYVLSRHRSPYKFEGRIHGHEIEIRVKI